MFENRDDLLECFEAIKTGSHGPFDQLSVREASGYVRMLQDEDFFFFLCFFSQHQAPRRHAVPEAPEEGH